MTTMQRSPVERITVEDWKDIGPLYYGEMGEDGECPVLAPDSRWVLVVEVNGGELWTMDVANAAAGETLARRVLVKGDVNLDKWTFWRVVYGSDAYVNGDYEAMAAAAERAEG